jgi:predicted transcriptional regulator YdeE
MRMKPELAHIAAFTVRGMHVRTINRDETDPKTAKLAGLWGRFFSEGIADKIPQRLPGSPIYGVYSSYESDAAGHYDLTAGVSVVLTARNSVVRTASGTVDSTADGSASTRGEPAGLVAVDVPAGEYLVFSAKGSMPGIVIDTWGAIHAYFAAEQRFVRKYTTDFEAYPGPDEVAIHIAVEV